MTAFIPVFLADGDVGAWTLVDDDSLAVVHGFRWTLTSWGYANRPTRHWEGGQSLAMHRAVVGLGYGDPQVVHHRNEDKLDNRRENLQVCANASEHGRIPHSSWAPEPLGSAA